MDIAASICGCVRGTRVDGEEVVERRFALGMYCMVVSLQKGGISDVFLGLAVPARGRRWELLHWRRAS